VFVEGPSIEIEFVSILVLMDFALKLNYPFGYNIFGFFVSILVLMDFALKR